MLLGTRRCKKRKKDKQLNILQTIQPDGVNAVEIAKGEWEQIDMFVDSGASETVISEDMVLSATLTEGPASRQGVQYEVANGVRIPNEGEKKFIGVSEENVASPLTGKPGWVDRKVDDDFHVRRERREEALCNKG